jgi:beta-glucuronidase
MKRIGANFVRLCHYPHHPRELDLCDELGLLVMIESSMNEWGHGHFVPTPEEAPLVVENGKRILEKMIRRDVSHPSVIICSVGNESAEERPDVRAGNSELIEYGKALDPTRLWTHVSNSYRKAEYTPEFYRSDDLLAVNAYAVHWLSPTPEEYEAGFPRQTQWLREQLERLHRDFPQKPIIIGECGWPMDSRDEWQSRAVIAEFKAADAPYMAGVTFWCYAHHPWPPELGPMSPYGYVSRDRQTRYKAFYTIERLFGEGPEKGPDPFSVTDPSSVLPGNVEEKEPSR